MVVISIINYHLKPQKNQPIMANMNPNGGTGGVLTPDGVICGSVKEINSKKKESESQKTASDTNKESKKETEKFKICCLDKAQKTHKFYRNIDNCVGLVSFKKTEIIKKNIEGSIKKNKELEKLIIESAKMLKELRGKVEDAHNAACTLDNCISKRIESLPEEGTISEIIDCLGIINTKTDSIHKKAQLAFEDVTKIAGIQTFSNIDSLSEFGNDLMTAMTEFKNGIDENIKDSGEKVTKSQEDLSKLLEELNQVCCERDNHSVKYDGLYGVITFICEGKCNTNLTVEDICSSLSINSDCTSKSNTTKPRQHHGANKD